MPDHKKSINTYERHCNDKITKAEKFLADNAGGLTARTVSDAEAHIKSLNDQFERLNKRWKDELMNKVLEENEALHDELDKKVLDMETKVDKCVERFDKLLKDYDLGIGAASAEVEDG